MLATTGRFGVAIVFVAVAAAVSASAALAAPGEIAYRCNNNDICLLDPDAPSSITNLSDNDSASAEGYPFWSPDGSKVGFTSNFAGPGSTGAENLFVMNPNAPGQEINVAVQLTSLSTGTAREAVWSPDGSKVAFQHGVGGSNSVLVVNSDGTSATPVTVAPQGSNPTFSPDGRRIAFSNGEQVYIANADGSGTPVPLANGQGHSPSWSPDGTKIALDVPQSSGSAFVNVRIVNVDGSGTPVTLTLSGSQFSFATWSPDGARIAFRDTFGGGFGFYRVANANGSADHPLVKVQNQNNNDAPSWSPNGARLGFSAFGGGVTEVHVVNADGSGSDQKLTSGNGNADAIWRPNKIPATPNPPLPGATVKPKLVWITKRIPWQPGRPIHVLSVYCPVPHCETKVKATSGSTLSHPKRKTVVAKSKKTSIAEGQTKQIKLKVTKAGAKLLLDRGSLKLDVTAKTKLEGQETSVVHHKVRVYVKQS